MKVLFPAVTCVLTSHRKPTLRAALESVLGQTRRDIHVLVLDSGQWIGRGDTLSQTMAGIHGDFAYHPLIEWVTTGEPDGFIRQACPVAYVTNAAIRAGLIRGRYMCTFYDDDRYEPQFMEHMAGYLDDNPATGAVWCSERQVNLRPDGTTEPRAVIAAGAPRAGATFDCQVDGAQVMWRTALLGQIGDPWLPEDPDNASCRHSDGIFLNKLGLACGTVPNVPEVLVEHRHTHWSVYSPHFGG